MAAAVVMAFLLTGGFEGIRHKLWLQERAIRRGEQTRVKEPTAADLAKEQRRRQQGLLWVSGLYAAIRCGDTAVCLSSFF